MMGSVLNQTRYSRWDYVQGWVMVLSMSALVYSTSEDKAPPPFLHMEPASWEAWWQSICSGSRTYAIGAVFLLVYYACDSFTSQWQAKLYSEHQMSEHQMMFAGNQCAIGFLG